MDFLRQKNKQDTIWTLFGAKFSFILMQDRDERCRELLCCLHESKVTMETRREEEKKMEMILQAVAALDICVNSYCLYYAKRTFNTKQVLFPS